MGDFRGIWMFSPIVMALGGASAPACIAVSTADSVPLFDTDISHVAATIDYPPPLLIVHDPDDPDSLYPTSEKIVDVWPGASLVTTRGLGDWRTTESCGIAPRFALASISSVASAANSQQRHRKSALPLRRQAQSSR